MKSSISIIIAREYLERVKRKSFIVTTILMPIFMFAMMCLPTVIMLMAGPEERNIGVIDDSGVIAQRLQNEGDMTFHKISEDLNTAKQNEEYDAILVIGENVVSAPNENVTFYSHGAPSLQTEELVCAQIESAVEDLRIRSYNIDNLQLILDEISVDLTMNTFRIDREEESATSAGLSYILGIFTMLILYMFILLYGNMVMTSIIEEKSNRVLELVVSSVKPFDLMMGKIAGIGCIAITQILIWAVLLICGSMWLMPMLSSMAADSGDASLIQAMAQLGDVKFITNLMIFMVLFIIGGYLFYSSIFAAIGSAVDNIQDASQLQSIAMVPIMIAFIIAMTVVADPNSTLAVWSSIIPFTSPMVMMARIPFGIPIWQSVTAVAVLFASVLAMIWLAAKIYRIGIFMYGKKPTIRDLARWLSYK